MSRRSLVSFVFWGRLGFERRAVGGEREGEGEPSAINAYGNAVVVDMLGNDLAGSSEKHARTYMRRYVCSVRSEVDSATPERPYRERFISSSECGQLSRLLTLLPLASLARRVPPFVSRIKHTGTGRA